MKMTQKKSTKRALLMSALALLMCVTMLVGSTFAWFTDSVISGNNIIKSGKLDVTMEWKDATTTGAQQTYKDASLGAIFNYDKWEPGYVEAKNIRIKNVGTLALKYQLNIDATGTITKLTDAIDVYYADGEKTLADRTMDGFNHLGTLTKVLSEMGTTASGDLLAGNGHTITLALKMRETAGNEYQDLSIGSTFSVQLLASQLTYEEDTFDDQYDKEAAWDGTIPTQMPDTLVVDTTKKLISINDTAAFAYLNTLVNDADFYNKYGSKWQYTIELNTDINLMGKAWTPITLSNFVAFDGKNHTISNLYVSTTGNSAGLFGAVTDKDKGHTSIKNFTIDGASVNGNKYVGAVVGSGTNAEVENVTVNNANVTGIKYVGGIFGSGNGSANNCTVKNSAITIDQIVIDPEDNSIDSKEAGGLIGYLSNDGKSSTTNKIIANNIVEDVTITAPTIASGLVAQPNSSNTGEAKIEITNNKMKNVVITTTEDDTAELYASNNVGEKSIVKDNTAENCKAVKTVSATSQAQLDTLISSNDNLIVDLTAGTYKMPAAVKNKTVTISGTKDTVIDVSSGLTYINGADLTLDGVTIKSTAGTGYNYGFADAKATVFNNCVIEGTLGLDYSSEFNNCTFNVSGNNYNLWTWGAGTATFNGCTFNCDGKAMLVYANVLDNGTNHQTVNINDCTFNDNGDDTVTGKAAIEITNTYTPVRTYDVIINNTTVNGFAQTVPGAGDFNAAYGSVDGSNIGTNVWGNKCKLPNTQINVVIDGVDVY